MLKETKYPDTKKEELLDESFASPAYYVDSYSVHVSHDPPHMVRITLAEQTTDIKECIRVAVAMELGDAEGLGTMILRMVKRARDRDEKAKAEEATSPAKSE